MGDSSSRANANRPAPSMQIARILWGAFLVSQVLILGAFAFVRMNGAEQAEPAPEVLKLVLLVMGWIMPLSAPLLSRLLAQRARGANPPADVGALVQRAMPAFIVGCALRESGAMFAAVSLFLFNEPLYWGPPAVLAFVAHLLAAPTVARFASWLGVEQQFRNVG